MFSSRRQPSAAPSRSLPASPTTAIISTQTATPFIAHFGDPQTSDLTVSCHHHRFHVHKSVVCRASGLFRDVYPESHAPRRWSASWLPRFLRTRGTEEAGGAPRIAGDHVRLPSGADAEIVHCMLEFMYSGEYDARAVVEREVVQAETAADQPASARSAGARLDWDASPFEREPEPERRSLRVINRGPSVRRPPSPTARHESDRPRPHLDMIVDHSTRSATSTTPSSTPSRPTAADPPAADPPLAADPTPAARLLLAHLRVCLAALQFDAPALQQHAGAQFAALVAARGDAWARAWAHLPPALADAFRGAPRDDPLRACKLVARAYGDARVEVWLAARRASRVEFALGLLESLGGVVAVVPEREIRS